MDSKHGATNIWSLSKFKQRLQEMQHFYNSAFQSDPRTLNSSLGMLGGDPFYDRYPWFRLIGRSFIYLSNLLVPFSLVHDVAVVGEKGEVKGHMTVSVRFMEESELQADDKVTSLSFTELPLPKEDCTASSHKLHLLPASSEISASIVDNPLESSVEMGVDIAMSTSQNTTVGSQLMDRHFEDMKPRPHGFQWSEHSSAFFKPIMSGVKGEETSATDEEKTHHLIKPAPSILLNDDEMRLSPLSPPYGRMGPAHSAVYTVGTGEEGGTRGGVASPPTAIGGKRVEENMKSAVDGKQTKGGVTLGQRSRSPSPTGRSRSESITKLQQLQQRMSVPRLAGMYVSSIPPSCEHLREGKQFYFRVTVLQATGIPRDFTDVFVQFKFLTGNGEAFSTEPLKNENQDLALGFYHMQNLSASVSPTFIQYLRSYPMLLEVFGHYQQHPLHKASTELDPNKSLTKKQFRSASPLPPSQSSPAPVRSPKTIVFDSTGSTHAYARVDVLAHFEICELGASGEYIPVPVNHNEDQPVGGVFLLQQALQRRLRITLICENGSELHWKRVTELVVGRVRSTNDVSHSLDNQGTALSLSLFPHHYLHVDGDDRRRYQFEAAWDSSLHNSPLLNKLSGANGYVFVTLSAYIELDNCTQPACLTKDLCVTIHSRDAKPSIPRSFFSFFTKKQELESNCCVGIYEVLLRKISNKTQGKSQDYQNPTASIYVRGEENLRAWRPRRESLILQHQDMLYLLASIEETEKARHVLQVRQKRLDLQKLERGMTMPSRQELSKLSDEHKAMLAEKCVALLMGVQTGKATGGAETESSASSANGVETSFSGRGMANWESVERRSRANSKRGHSRSILAAPPLCVPEVYEKTHVKGNPLSRKGYLDFFGEQEGVWLRKYVVIRRPYILIYSSEKDTVERGVINLAGAKVQYSKEKQNSGNTFSICTKYRGVLLQAKEKEVQDWIYAMDPLLAGSIKSQLSSRKKSTS